MCGCRSAARLSRQPGSSTRRASRPRTPWGETAAGYDAEKKVNGRKRFIVTDTLGAVGCGARDGGVLAGP
jgi:hypothetical protein